jgi:hypothetical protein
MNVGFVEANKLYNWQCFVFHDVDLLPEDDRNVYSLVSLFVYLPGFSELGLFM